MNDDIYDLLGRWEQLSLPIDRYEKVELDLGCGKGGFTLQVAKKNFKNLILAADIKLGRLKKLNNKALANKIDNIVLIRSMAWNLMTYALPDNLLDKVHVICPDPWPKKRHRSKRLLSSEFFNHVSCKMKNNSLLHFASDEPFYVDQVKRSIAHLPFEERDLSLLEGEDKFQGEFELIWQKQGKKVEHCCYQLIK